MELKSSFKSVKEEAFRSQFQPSKQELWEISRDEREAGNFAKMVSKRGAGIKLEERLREESEEETENAADIV